VFQWNVPAPNAPNVNVNAASLPFVTFTVAVVAGFVLSESGTTGTALYTPPSMNPNPCISLHSTLPEGPLAPLGGERVGERGSFHSFDQ
jgi:hypothetical protein